MRGKKDYLPHKKGLHRTSYGLVATLSLAWRQRCWVLKPLFPGNANGMYSRHGCRGPLCWDTREKTAGLWRQHCTSCQRPLFMPPLPSLYSLVQQDIFRCFARHLRSVLRPIALHPQTPVAREQHILSTLSGLSPGMNCSAPSRGTQAGQVECVCQGAHVMVGRQPDHS